MNTARIGKDVDCRATLFTSRLTLFGPAANSFGFSGRVGRPQANDQINGANTDQVAVGQSYFPIDATAPDESAVGALQVLQHHAAVTAVDAYNRVASRDAGYIQPDVASRIPSDDVIAL
jgi:hypothetical protein